MNEIVTHPFSILNNVLKQKQGFYFKNRHVCMYLTQGRRLLQLEIIKRIKKKNIPSENLKAGHSCERENVIRGEI